MLRSLREQAFPITFHVCDLTCQRCFQWQLVQGRLDSCIFHPNQTRRQERQRRKTAPDSGNCQTLAGERRGQPLSPVSTHGTDLRL
jgi:hypothetical protein